MLYFLLRQSGSVKVSGLPYLVLMNKLFNSLMVGEQSSSSMKFGFLLENDRGHTTKGHPN